MAAHELFLSATGLRRWSVAALLGILGACTVAGPPHEPLTRELTWFGYLAGDDIRRACGLDGPDRYRFVYNAIYTEQVRSYDLVDFGDGGELETNVFGRIELARVLLSNPLPSWFGETSRATLSPWDVATIVTALQESGFDDPPPVGTRLDSGNFYWIVLACRGGRFHFNAYAPPSDQFEQIRFLEPLLAHDNTGIAVNPVRDRPVRGMDRPGRPQAESAASGGPHFSFKVSELGIIYQSSP